MGDRPGRPEGAVSFYAPLATIQNKDGSGNTNRHTALCNRNDNLNSNSWLLAGCLQGVLRTYAYWMLVACLLLLNAPPSALAAVLAPAPIALLLLVLLATATAAAAAAAAAAVGAVVAAASERRQTPLCDLVCRSRFTR